MICEVNFYTTYTNYVLALFIICLWFSGKCNASNKIYVLLKCIFTVFTWITWALTEGNREMRLFCFSFKKLSFSIPCIYLNSNKMNVIWGQVLTGNIALCAWRLKKCGRHFLSHSIHFNHKCQRVYIMIAFVRRKLLRIIEEKFKGSKTPNPFKDCKNLLSILIKRQTTCYNYLGRLQV